METAIFHCSICYFNITPSFIVDTYDEKCQAISLVGNFYAIYHSFWCWPDCRVMHNFPVDRNKGGIQYDNLNQFVICWWWRPYVRTYISYNYTTDHKLSLSIKKFCSGKWCPYRIFRVKWKYK